MELGCGRRPSGKNERLQRFERVIDLVAALLDPRDLLCQHAQTLLRRFTIFGRRLGNGEIGADVEEVVLDVTEPGDVLLRHAGGRNGDADLGVQFVNRSVCLNPRVDLRHAAHVAQMSFAIVAEAGVNLCQIDGHCCRA